ncbi:MAG: hypothetical protein IMF14_03700 [Proteobacteria bacterium]|nr:hypothetical protein [Pseudomonadota bacterium]
MKISNDKDISRPHLYGIYLSAFSMLALAGALVYFTVELVGITRQIPDILLTVEKTSEKIGPVVEEIGEIRELVQPILDEVAETRKVIKPAIAEYAKTNAQIPRLLDEVEATRKQIPDILNQVEATRAMLPDVMKTVDGASAAVVTISKEVEATRPLIPKVLAEVEKTRNSIPPMMDRADELIAKARVAGKEASRGAVTGVFSGILMAPFVFVGDVGKQIVGVSDEEAEQLSDEDFAIIEAATSEILENGKVGDIKTWKNKESGSSGDIKLLDITSNFDDNECRELHMNLYSNGDLLKKQDITLCRNDDGEWGFE